jgi:hypothetical protein
MEVMWMRSIMHLEVQRMLEEVSLLLGAVGDFDSAVIDRDGVEVEPCLCSKRADGTCIRAYVNRSAQTLLCERADVAKLAYAVVAVVVWQAMRVGDGARGLAKQR